VEAVGSTETSVHIYKNTWRHIQKRAVLILLIRTRKFNTSNVRTQHYTRFWAYSVYIPNLKPTYLRFRLILSSHIIFSWRIRSPRCSLTSDLYTLLCPSNQTTCSVHCNPHYLLRNIMVRGLNNVVVLTMTEFSSRRLLSLFVGNMLWIICEISMLSEVYARFFLCVLFT